MSSHEKINDDPIGRTSMTSATARANEFNRPNALVRDPFARVYAGEVGPQTVKSFAQIEDTTAESITTDIAVRTRFLDDLLEKNMTTIKQVVILACGGDFRPYRLSLPKNSTPIEFYLLDVPEVLAYRQKCLEKFESPLPATNCKVIEIACNLANEDWSSKLLEHGFKPDQPTFWLAEGFFHYLTKQAIEKLFEHTRKLSAKDSCIVFDLVSPRLKKLLAIISFALDDEQEVQQVFNEFGCEEIECTSFTKIGSMYGRTVSRDRTFIVTAKLSNRDLHSIN
jgi:methyltransferase (TIGR00027 family)